MQELLDSVQALMQWQTPLDAMGFAFVGTMAYIVISKIRAGAREDYR